MIALYFTATVLVFPTSLGESGSGFSASLGDNGSGVDWSHYYVEYMSTLYKTSLIGAEEFGHITLEANSFAQFSDISVSLSIFGFFI